MTAPVNDANSSTGLAFGTLFRDSELLGSLASRPDTRGEICQALANLCRVVGDIWALQASL